MIKKTILVLSFVFVVSGASFASEACDSGTEVGNGGPRVMRTLVANERSGTEVGNGGPKTCSLPVLG